MVDYNNTFVYSDQPTTCPKCLRRSDIILNLSHTLRQYQVHKCLNNSCGNEFVMEYDKDFFNGFLSKNKTFQQ